MDKVNRIFWACNALLGLAMIGWFLPKGEVFRVILGVGTIAFFCLPALAERLLHIKRTPQMDFLIYLFLFCAFTIGMGFQCYHWLPLWDKVAHTLSGTFFGMMGLFLFYRGKPGHAICKEDYPLATGFAFCFSMTVAGVWEIYEYFLSFVWPTDPQNVLTTGVGDTMQDMIVCLIGTLVLVWAMRAYYQKGKTGFLMGAFESFYHANGLQKEHSNPLREEKTGASKSVESDEQN